MFPFFRKETEDNEEKSGQAKLWLILLAAALGVALILFGGNFQKEEKETTETVYSPTEDELIVYQNYIEERVKSLCESVAGVNDVTAVVTLSGSFESVYATELLDGNEEYVIIGSGSSASALYLTRLSPEIAGIGVVCRGGGNTEIRKELTALIGATFHISSNRIYITEAQK